MPATAEETPIDNVAQAIRDQRQKVGLTLRQVAQQSEVLASIDPAKYASFSRGLPYHVERQGLEFLRRGHDRLKLITLMTILFGTAEEFTRLAGVNLPYFGVESVPSAPTQAVPLIREGELDVTMNEITTWIALREATGGRVPAWPCDYLLEVTSYDMAPVVYPGQFAGVQRRAKCAPGELAVLHYQGTVRVAWALPSGNFALVNVQSPDSDGVLTLKGEDGDSVIGVVSWTQPYLPLAVNA